MRPRVAQRGDRPLTGTAIKLKGHPLAREQSVPAQSFDQRVEAFSGLAAPDPQVGTEHGAGGLRSASDDLRIRERVVQLDRAAPGFGSVEPPTHADPCRGDENVRRPGDELRGCHAKLVVADHRVRDHDRAVNNRGACTFEH